MPIGLPRRRPYNPTSITGGGAPPAPYGGQSLTPVEQRSRVQAPLSEGGISNRIGTPFPPMPQRRLGVYGGEGTPRFNYDDRGQIIQDPVGAPHPDNYTPQGIGIQRGIDRSMAGQEARDQLSSAKYQARQGLAQRNYDTYDSMGQRSEYGNYLLNAPLNQQIARNQLRNSLAMTESGRRLVNARGSGYGGNSTSPADVFVPDVYPGDKIGSSEVFASPRGGLGLRRTTPLTDDERKYWATQATTVQARNKELQAEAAQRRQDAIARKAGRGIPGLQAQLAREREMALHQEQMDERKFWAEKKRQQLEQEYNSLSGENKSAFLERQLQNNGTPGLPRQRRPSDSELRKPKNSPALGFNRPNWSELPGM